MTRAFGSRWALLLGLCVVAGLLTGGARSQEKMAKVGFESFSPIQQAWLWDKVDTYANFEAFLRACGKNSNIEARLLAAASDCATPAAIAQVRTVFRRKVAEYAKKNLPGICSQPNAPQLATSIMQSLDSAVQDVRNACRNCTICGG